MNVFESVGRAMVEGQTIARADDFRVELEDGWVHIYDGEGAPRVSLPHDVWQRLVQSCK